MKIKKIIPVSLLLCCSLSFSIFGQNPINDELRKEALDFSLSIIQTYFSKDCESLTNKFAPNLYSIEDDEIILLEEIKEEICESVEDALEDESKIFQDYLLDYNYQVLTKAEFQLAYEEEYGVSDSIDFEYLNSTFFFFGNKTKDPKVKEYLWFDLEVFAIKKVNGRWLIIGGL